MKRMLTLLLILALTGCTAAPPAPETDTPPDPEPAPVAAFTVEDQAVPVWAYRYWLDLACQQATSLYEAAGEVPDWTADGPDSLSAQVREQAMADAALYAIVDDWAADWGCDLTAEDQIQLDQLWQERAAAHGGEEAYLRSLADRGLTADQARQLAQTGQRYQKLHAAALDPQNPHAPTPEALSAFGEESGICTVDRIQTTGEDARHRIEVLFSRLNAAPDPQAAFGGLAQEGDDHTGPRTCRPGDETLPPALQDAARDLKPGQHSGILESGEGYAILLRLPTDLTALVPQWLDAQLLSAVQAAQITPLPAMAEVPIPATA